MKRWWSIAGALLLGVPVTPAAALAVPPCFGERPTLVGTGGFDHLRGTPGRDVIQGLGGDDIIDGVDGNDLLCGDSGRDLIYGGRGHDKSSGGRDRDVLLPGPGDDLVRGGRDRDRIVIYGGRKVLDGGPAATASRSSSAPGRTWNWLAERGRSARTSYGSEGSRRCGAPHARTSCWDPAGTT